MEGYPHVDANTISRCLKRHGIKSCIAAQKTLISIMACFSYNGIGRIKIVTGRSNAEEYINYLDEYVMPYARENFGSDYYILHDNAPIHTAINVRQFLTVRLPDRVHSNPPYSPDLNPIENVGNKLKRIVKSIYTHMNFSEFP